MFTLFDPVSQRLPVKIWLNEIGQLDEVCLQQALHLANHPYTTHWVALMPDAHPGYGMPVGGVIATEEVIIPNAVGVDIGCGVIFEQTDLPVELLLSKTTHQGKLVQSIVKEILSTIPTGFEHYSLKQPCLSAERFYMQLSHSACIKNMSLALNKEIERASFQVGTLGGGNHFIELQRDENDHLGVMVHSGSRNLGFTLCNYFNKKAKALNTEWHSPLPSKWDLSYLPIDSEAGEAYIQWMQFALDFASENRERILEKVMAIIRRQVEKHDGHIQLQVTEHHHCHHNDASLETHNGKSLWIHRKGAIHAGTGEAGIIPGAMGSYSYLVRGKGSIDSFNSCSHGAGRLMSRKAAKEKFGVQETIGDLSALGVYLGKVKTADLGEESRQAYKNIDDVINNELDLVEPVRKLKTLAVVKG